MKRTLIGFLVLVGLAVAAFILVKRESSSHSSLQQSDMQFAVDDPSRIHKIFLADRMGHKTVLERKAQYWMVNGKYVAAGGPIRNILETIQKVRVQYIVPESAIPGMIRDLAVNGIKCELYDQKGRRFKAFYVGGVTAMEDGTYMIMEDAEKPYVTHIPGFHGTLRGRFDLTEEEWRDKTVLRYQPDEIASIQMEYPENQKESFVLERKGNSFTIRKMFPSPSDKILQPDESVVANYLAAYAYLGAEAFENNNPNKENLKRQSHFAKLTLTGTNGESLQIRFIPIFRTNDDGNLVLDNSGRPAAVERYFADVSNGQFYLVQQLVFGKIFYRYSGFFPRSS